MPLIKILPTDILKTRATETLLRIARYDVCDHSGEFEPERFSHLAELATIQKEVAMLGLDWTEFYTMVIGDVECYDSGKDDKDELGIE